MGGQGGQGGQGGPDFLQVVKSIYRCGDFEAFDTVSWWYNYHTFPEIYLVRVMELVMMMLMV